MKYLFCLIALLFFTAGHSFAQSKLLVGAWKVTTIDGKTPSGRDATLTLVFLKDGSIELVESDRTEKGTWVLSSDNKTITVKMNNDNTTETVTVVELGKKTMKLDNRGSIAEFEKAGKAPKAPKVKLKGVAKKLAGTWQVTTINGVEMDGAEFPITLIQFNADGTVWTSAVGSGGEAGTWKVSSDETQIVININGEEKPANFKLSDKDNGLEISETGAIVRLKRVDTKIAKPERFEAPWEDPIEPKDPNAKDETDKTNTMTMDPKILIGEWTVVSIDNDPMEERKLIFKINENKTFTVSENGELEREGTWEIQKDNTFYIRDKQGYASNYTVTPGTTGVILLKDYYGEMKLEKR